MDLFEAKNIKPMLIGTDGKPFDSDEYIYEIKLDGERCIAYLDPSEGTELRNKRNVRLKLRFPELAGINGYVRKRCILDGELIVINNGVPDFSTVLKRCLMSNRFKIDLESKKNPASFVVYDMLYYENKDITDMPLTKRRELLLKNVKCEDSLLALSRAYDSGTKLYSLAESMNLEGIVAKKKTSLYYTGKRTKDWIKIKNLKDDDFVVCGYIYKDNNMASLVLGQFRRGELVYKGHVTLGVSGKNFDTVRESPIIDSPDFSSYPPGNEDAIWVEPVLVCTVKYMDKNASGTMRQPVFKGLRHDKSPQECVENTGE